MTEGKDYEIFKNRYEKLNLISYNLTNVQILDSFYKSNNLALIYKNDILKKRGDFYENSYKFRFNMRNISSKC